MARGGIQNLSDQAARLGLAAGFTDRVGSSTEPDDLASRAMTWLRESRPMKQNHWPALTLALIAQTEELLSALGVESLPSGLEADEIVVEEDADSSVRNTLNLATAGGNVARLRPHYNNALNVIRVEMRRAHPSSAPHATQSWPQ